MSDEDQKHEVLRRLALIASQQKAIAQSVADVALSLNFEGRTARDRHSETQGLILGLLSDLRQPAARKRRDSDDTSRFRLPGGEEGDRIQLTRKTQKRIALAVLRVLLHATALFLAGLLGHAWHLLGR
jgi:hypothetical protein